MKPLILLFSLLFFVNVHAQSPAWQWAYGGLGTNGAAGNYIKTDPSNNIYVSGNYQGKSMVISNDTLVSVDTNGYAENVYLLKFNPAGNVLWGRNIAGASGSVENPVMCTDNKGSVYLGGIFDDSALVFGNDTVVDTDFPGMMWPFFLVKYNSAGDVVWAVTGDTSVRVQSIATDANGNIYVSGVVYFSSAKWGDNTLSNPNYPNTYLSFEGQLDSSGNPTWAVPFNSSGYVNVYANTADAAGNSYVTGTFTSPSITIGAYTLTDTAQYMADIFTTKINPSGTPLWAQGTNGNYTDRGYAIDVDGQGGVYVAGAFESDTIHFDTLALPNADTNGYETVFLVKYDASGNTRWAREVQTTNSSSASGLCTGGDGNIYVTGYYAGPMAIFGKDTLINGDTSQGQQSQVFIAVYDTTGNVLGTTGAFGAGENISGGITTDAGNNIYITGYFYGTDMIFGADTLSGPTADEASNIYVAKYGSIVNGINTPSLSNSIAVFPNPTAGMVSFKGVSAGNTLEVFDLLGQNILSTTLTGDLYQLNLRGNAQGIYLYRITNNAAVVQTGKIVLY